MKLVFIYGPPAVGKLTVAKELSRLTGFRLFDNHVSIDFAKSVFRFGTPPFWRVVDRARKDILEEAAKEGVDTIFTFVYGGKMDDEFVKEVMTSVESHRGKVWFVRLHCSRAELLRRVGNETRKKRGKLATKSGLKELIGSYALDAEIPLSKSLSLDTAVRSPKQSAMEIVTRLGLGSKGT